MILRHVSCLVWITIGLCLPSLYGQKGGPNAQTPPAANSAATLSGIDCDRLMRDIDTDRDALISKLEWDRYFANRDEDRSDTLSRNEIQVGGLSISQAPGTTAAEKPEWVREREALFSKLDADHDGTVSRNEWTANDRSFHILDANGDNAISTEEFLSLNGRFWNEILDDWDTNRDHLLTRSEWLDTDESFNRLDKDRNGIIDRWEFYSRR
jgi:Ca2+-binding EF-hand superfamily protein